MAPVKTTAELIEEAEKLLEQERAEMGIEPEKPEGTPTETEDEIPEDKQAPEEGEKAPDDAGIADKAGTEDKADAPDPRDEEIARLKDELMKAKANAGRVAQTAEANDRLRERISVLEQEITALKAVREPAKREPERAATDDVLAELIDEYGDDSLPVKMHLKSKAENDALRGELNAIRQEIGTVKETSVKSDRQAFIVALKGEVPEFEAIRDNPAFVSFLSEPVSDVSRRTYLDELKDADVSLDAATTAKIYKAFKEKTTASGQSGAGNTQQKKDKGKLTAPGSSGKAEVNKNIETFTKAEIEKMLTKASALRSEGKIKESDALKARVYAAIESSP